MSEDTPAETTSRVHITVKPLTAKVVDPQPIEQQQPIVQPQQQTNTPAPAIVDPIQILTGEVEDADPKYALSKSIIKKLAKEIAVTRKRIKAQKLQQGKGKRKLLLADSSDDEEELVAAAVDVVEDAAANKVSVETQFQRYLDAGAPEGRPKKEKATPTPKNVVDLVSTPPPPSPTPVVEEQASIQQLVSPHNIYQRAILETVKAKVNQDAELKYFFATLPALF